MEGAWLFRQLGLIDMSYCSVLDPSNSQISSLLESLFRLSRATSRFFLSKKLVRGTIGVRNDCFNV